MDAAQQHAYEARLLQLRRDVVFCRDEWERAKVAMRSVTRHPGQLGVARAKQEKAHDAWMAAIKRLNDFERQGRV